MQLVEVKYLNIFKFEVKCFDKISESTFKVGKIIRVFTNGKREAPSIDETLSNFLKYRKLSYKHIIYFAFIIFTVKELLNFGKRFFVVNQIFKTI